MKGKIKMKKNSIPTKTQLFKKIIDKKRCSQVALLSFILLFTQLSVKSQELEKDQLLESSIVKIMDNDKLAGMSCGIIKNNKIVWQFAYGWSDIENKIPMTSNSIFMLASVSKTITGTTLMLLYDKGKLKLDDNINKYIPFKIRNPEYPDDSITIRMLLTHTSSFNDNFKYITPLYQERDVTSPPLGELVKDFFSIDGKYYESSNFTKDKPGESFNYSNMNFVVVAYLVELISQEPFNDYCKKNLLKPLDMKRSAWYYSELDEQELAVQYELDSTQSNGIKRIAHYSWPGLADGCFHASVPQYANFLRMVLNNGIYKGKTIIGVNTVSEIFKPQKVKGITSEKTDLPTPDWGLIWGICELSGQKFYYHTGGGTGIKTAVLINPANKSGLIWFITGEAKTMETYTSIFFLLLNKLQEN